MKQAIENIKTKFVALKTIVGHDFSIEHLEDSAFVSKLNEAVELTYIELNEGMCEEISLCTTCAQNRDNLHELMVMLEDIEAGSTLTDSVGDHFIAFSLELDVVLKRIDNVLESL